MEVKRVILPRVSKVEATEAQRHAGLFAVPRLQLGDHAYHVEVLSPTERQDSKAFLSVCLAEGDHWVWLSLPQWVNPRLPGGEVRKSQLSELPKSLLTGVVKTQIAPLLSLLPGLPRNVTRIVEGDRLPGTLWTLRLRVTPDQGHPVVVSLRYPETTYPMIQSMLDSWRISQPEMWEALPVHVGVLVGSCTVKLSDLNLFKEGDFLLLDRPNDYYQKNAVLALKQHKLARVTLLDEAIRIEKIMNEENQPNVGSVVSGLDDIPLTLDFRLAQKELSLAELKRLGVGSILSLDVPQNQLVTILVNGKKIGDGELVTVDNKVGVRIDSLVIDGNG